MGARVVKSIYKLTGVKNIFKDRIFISRKGIVYQFRRAGGPGGLGKIDGFFS